MSYLYETIIEHDGKYPYLRRVPFANKDDLVKAACDGQFDCIESFCNTNNIISLAQYNMEIANDAAVGAAMHGQEQCLKLLHKSFQQVNAPTNGWDKRAYCAAVEYKQNNCIVYILQNVRNIFTG